MNVRCLLADEEEPSQPAISFYVFRLLIIHFWLANYVSAVEALLSARLHRNMTSCGFRLNEPAVSTVHTAARTQKTLSVKEYASATRRRSAAFVIIKTRYIQARLSSTSSSSST